MKKSIREHLDKKREELNMSTGVTSLTFDQLQELMKTAIRESKTLNPIEQKELDDKIAAEKRRLEMVAQLGKIEEQAAWAKKHGCSHTVDQAGKDVSKGAYGSRWNTSGQMHENDTITLICLRCSNTWHFNATPQERNYAANAEHGLLGFPPPHDERLIKEEITKEVTV